MLIHQHAFVCLQDAFDRATTAYKVQVGDRTAWSSFYDSVHHGLNSLTSSRPLAPDEYAEAVGVRALELRLEVLAEYPELLALTRQELNITLGYPLDSHVQRFEPLRKAIPLRNHYDILQVEHSQAAQEFRQHERDLESCAELRPDSALQQAVDKMGLAYYTFCLSQSQEKAKQSRAIWNGICSWLARKLGPIPGPLLEIDALDGVLQVLRKGIRPLDKPCAYFRLSMRWLVDDLERPLLLYKGVCDEFYRELSTASHGNHEWQSNPIRYTLRRKCRRPEPVAQPMSADSGSLSEAPHPERDPVRCPKRKDSGSAADVFTPAKRNKSDAAAPSRTGINANSSSAGQVKEYVFVPYKHKP